MGIRPVILALTSVSALALACGDAIIVVGDAPGTMRIVVGVPDTPGDSIGERATETELQGPLGVAADANGTLYVADSQNARILGIASSGMITLVVDHGQRTTEPRLREPDGMALDGAELVIADPRGNRIWRLDIASAEIEVIAGTGTSGDSPDGTDALAADLAAPAGVAVGPDGLVYFTERNLNRVRRIEADGSLKTVAGTSVPGSGGDGGPATDATFLQPTGLAFGPGGLFISDTRNHKVRLLDTQTGIITTLVGTGARGFGGDQGPAAAARLNNPRALAVSSDGRNLFIADSENHRVRLVILDTRTITTIAGTGADEFNGDLLAAGETSLSGPEGVATNPFDLLFISDTRHHVVRRTAIGFRAAP